MIDHSSPNPAKTFPLLLGNKLFSNQSHVSVTLSNTVPDYLGIMHAHDFIEIVYIISGLADYTVDDRQSQVKKGDLVIVNYQTAHAFIGHKNPEDPFIAYDLAFSPDFLDSALLSDMYFEEMHASFLLGSLLPAQFVKPTINLTGNGFDDFSRLYNSMFQEFQNKQHGYLDILRANIIELIIKIYRKMDEATSNTSESIREQMVDNILKYIQLHYQEKLTLSDIANRIFLSKDYLNRLIKKRTGKTFVSYLQCCRIECAYNMLQNSNHNIDEIAYQCGFQDPKFFYTFFKRHTGKTPGEYRLEISELKER